MTRHAFVFQCIIINKGLFDGFSPELQSLMKETVTKYSKEDMKIAAESEEDEIAQLESEGMTVTYPDAEVFKAAFEPFYESYEQQRGDTWAELIALMS